MYAYILAAPHNHLQFAQAEFASLTGCEADGRIGIAPIAADISRAAFVSNCFHIAATGSSLAEVCADAQAKGLAWEGFRIETFYPGEGALFQSMEPVIAAANAITGRPDLTSPSVRIALAVAGDFWALGPIVSSYRSDWPAHEQRPHFFSASLPTRFSRGMVNLVASPGDTLIDPCCGVGVALIEALSCGIEAYGCDINPKMAGQAAENLCHLRLPQRVFVADARGLGGCYDAAVLDLPYGRNVLIHDGLYPDLLRILKRISRRSAIVAARDLSSQLECEFGFTVRRCVQVPKSNIIRHIHVVSAPEADDGT
jgi:tRNA G10  N-methylase Trm11